MQNLTLQQIFGANATQTATKLTISKTDLPGLTPVINNRAEQLLVALILQVWQAFQGLLVDELGERLIDELGQTIEYDQRNLYEKLNLSFWKRQFTGEDILDTFVIDVFIHPPPAYNSELKADLLSQ